MPRNEKPEKIAARIFREKKRRRAALARLPLEKKVGMISQMRAIAEEIRIIAEASRKS